MREDKSNYYISRGEKGFLVSETRDSFHGSWAGFSTLEEALKYLREKLTPAQQESSELDSP